MARDIQDIVDRQVKTWRTEQRARDEEHARPGPIVTVSRQLGAGGDRVAREVARLLDYQCIDKEVVEEIAKRSDVRQELVEAVDQQTRSFIQGWIEGVLRGRDFDEGDFHQYLLLVVHSFSRLGQVVLIGRGANFVPVDRPALHVRVIAPQEKRVAWAMERYACDRTRAQAILKESDSARRRFVKRLFQRDWDDPLAYDVWINTARVPLDAAAGAIADAVARLKEA